MAQGHTVFAFLFYFLEDSPSLYVDKANKAYRAPFSRNPKRKKEAHMCVYTCPYDGQIKHIQQETPKPKLLSPWICIIDFKSQISHNINYLFRERLLERVYL